MTHPLERVEEIVARCEIYEYSLPRDEQRALIASWRERGAALRQISDAALEAAMLEWYGPDWRHRFFPGRSHTEIQRVMDAMRRAIEAANAVKDKP